MQIKEIFYSLQGEGPLVGLPTIFVRTTGCNLRCSYCDTTYAYYGGKEANVAEILHQLKQWRCSRVCLTGGEPLLQEDLPVLLDALLEERYAISVETNGSCNIAHLVERPITICLDWKGPASGMHHHMDPTNISLLRVNDVFKCIIADRSDYEYAKEILNQHDIKGHIVMQPVWGQAAELADWIVGDELEVRLSLQLHKLLWGNRKGV
jgi:7-carboxy-7-deazaguanine synthase